MKFSKDENKTCTTKAEHCRGAGWGRCDQAAALGRDNGPWWSAA